MSQHPAKNAHNQSPLTEKKNLTVALITLCKWKKKITRKKITYEMNLLLLPWGELILTADEAKNQEWIDYRIKP